MEVFAVEEKVDLFDAIVRPDIGAIVVTPSVPYRVRMVASVCVATVWEASNVCASKDSRGTCAKTCPSIKALPSIKTFPSIKRCPQVIRHPLPADTSSSPVPHLRFGL
jgi:hypothetical protein